MKKTLLLLFASAMLLGCKQKGTFCIEGNITGAADTVLYLEHLTLGEGAVDIDSIRLGADGAFCFKKDANDAPEFYRLRIGGQGINLGIDSIETVRVKADIKDMSFGYSVEGSGTCDTIRLLCLKLADMEREARRIATDRNYTVAERDSMIERIVTQYKTEVKLDFIQNHYSATYSYYACFQALGGQLVFDPMQDKSDLTWMRAVANAWSERYPSSQRSQNLVNIIQECRRNHTTPRQIVLNIDGEKVRELGIIDMTFPDINGRERTLSDLRGNVVLLDFTAFSIDGSTQRTLLLRELYSKYHEQGLEIYQVGVAQDAHWWRQSVDQLPWVNVLDQTGYYARLYNVQAVGDFFIIDRDNTLQQRVGIDGLEKAVAAFL